METKHTPGPWVERNDHVTTKECKNRHFADKICECNWGNDDENEANMRLIAAAPDLLDALIDIIEQFECTTIDVGADLADSIRIFGRKAVHQAISGKYGRSDD
ncbi:MAG TPA: hypothetical protein P5531_10715 [Bacteroidales bacterium]|nr:hypothetical protein [Bacteroidales bacterium]HSA43566.1 hypothetical protein [Bacteroidales bacterium]